MFPDLSKNLIKLLDPLHRGEKKRYLNAHTVVDAHRSLRPIYKVQIENCFSKEKKKKKAEKVCNPSTMKEKEFR